MIGAFKASAPPGGSRAVWGLLLPALLACAAAAQDAGPPAPKSRMVEIRSTVAGIHYKDGNRRDPFLSPIVPKKLQVADEEESLGTPPPGIAGTHIEKAMLQGVSIRDTGRIAVVRGADGRGYFLKEGDRLFDGYLKTIDIDSITLVREIRMRSGKVRHHAVTKRLRTP